MIQRRARWSKVKRSKFSDAPEFAQPYMVPKYEKYNINDFYDVYSEIRENEWYTDPFCVEFRYGYKKKTIN